MIFQQLPLGQFIGTLWFGLLFFAGITSTVALTQPPMAFLQDEMGWPRKKAAIVVISFLFIFGNFIVFNIEHGVIDELDFWIGTVGLVVFSFLEIIIFAWIFGMDKAWDEINEGAAIRIPRIFYYMIKYVTPVSLAILLVVWTYQAGFDLLLLRNANPEDIPYLLLTRGIIVALILVGVLQVRRVSKNWK
ncbi:MAG: hypothetical protein F4Z29_13340 [Gemmatimonadetes bacterium]|nr:hypothetical protein [Gemmatimonadota bacterium]